MRIRLLRMLLRSSATSAFDRVAVFDAMAAPGASATASTRSLRAGQLIAGLQSVRFRAEGCPSKRPQVHPCSRAPRDHSRVPWFEAKM